VVIAGLAAFGEVLELVSGIAGARRAGGSKWGAWGALAGGILGAAFGTVLVPVPVLGSVIGMCLGAFAGAASAEWLSGRALGQSLRSGQGAAVGKLFGILGKLAVGLAIWLIAAAAAFWP
jgi:uncharacterized protein YqgC (DUF456 family)